MRELLELNLHVYSGDDTRIVVYNMGEWPEGRGDLRIILWTFVIKIKNWTLIHSILGQLLGQFFSLSLCLFYSN